MPMCKYKHQMSNTLAHLHTCSKREILHTLIFPLTEGSFSFIAAHLADKLAKYVNGISRSLDNMRGCSNSSIMQTSSCSKVPLECWLDTEFTPLIGELICISPTSETILDDRLHIVVSALIGTAHSSTVL